MADKKQTEKRKEPAHRKHDPAAIAAKDRKAKPKTPKTVEAVCVMGFRVSADEAVAPGEVIELPYRDFCALERTGKVITSERYNDGGKPGPELNRKKAAAKKGPGRPKKDAA